MIIMIIIITIIIVIMMIDPPARYAVIWVNGDKFEFSAEAMRRAAELQLAWQPDENKLQ